MYTPKLSKLLLMESYKVMQTGDVPTEQKPRNEGASRPLPKLRLSLIPPTTFNPNPILHCPLHFHLRVPLLLNHHLPPPLRVLLLLLIFFRFCELYFLIYHNDNRLRPSDHLLHSFRIHGISSPSEAHFLL